MRIQSPRVCLSVLVSLWALGAAPAIAANLSYSGEMGLSVSPVSISGIPIDTGALSEQLCGVPRPMPPTKPLVQCHVIVKHVNIPIQVKVEDSQATVRALQLDGAEPLATTCGTWEAKLTLDPTVSQTASPIALEEQPESPGRGLFAVVLEMSTNLHLANRETGQTADFPLRLGLGVSGPWALSPTSGRPVLLAGFLAEQMLTFENCIPIWVFDDPFHVVSSTGGCKMCLVAMDEDLPGGGSQGYSE